MLPGSTAAAAAAAAAAVKPSCTQKHPDCSRKQSCMTATLAPAPAQVAAQASAVPRAPVARAPAQAQAPVVVAAPVAAAAPSPSRAAVFLPKAKRLCPSESAAAMDLWGLHSPGATAPRGRACPCADKGRNMTATLNESTLYKQPLKGFPSAYHCEQAHRPVIIADSDPGFYRRTVPSPVAWAQQSGVTLSAIGNRSVTPGM